MRTNDAEHARPIVRIAIDSGINFFDTANIPSRSGSL
jgi:aryl-alcohol dehydrogenase-like predicted oxidoreductase